MTNWRFKSRHRVCCVCGNNDPDSLEQRLGEWVCADGDDCLDAVRAQHGRGDDLYDASVDDEMTGVGI